MAPSALLDRCEALADRGGARAERRGERASGLSRQALRKTRLTRFSASIWASTAFDRLEGEVAWLLQLGVDRHQMVMFRLCRPVAPSPTSLQRHEADTANKVRGPLGKKPRQVSPRSHTAVGAPRSYRVACSSRWTKDRYT